MENLTRHAIFQNDHFFDLARRRTKALDGDLDSWQCVTSGSIALSTHK